jgi:hypothetical protein
LGILPLFQHSRLVPEFQPRHLLLHLIPMQKLASIASR